VRRATRAMTGVARMTMLAARMKPRMASWTAVGSSSRLAMGDPP
jgi:hypothetical protein